MITDKQRWQLYISFQAVAVTMEYFENAAKVLQM